MKQTVLTELRGSYCAFMRDAGLLQWDLTAEQELDDPSYGKLFVALADIEDDSRYMQVKLRHAGALRRVPIKDFNAQWLCEEQEHSTALRALAKLRGVDSEPLNHGLSARDTRSVFAMLGLRVGRIHEEAITAAYLALGSIQEYVAISTYVYLASIVQSENQQTILRNIARQEGRHMKFYRSGASAILSEASPFTRKFVRMVFDTYWRPPGIDLLGRDRWLDAFRPILDDARARGRFLGADRILDGIPGLSGMMIMERFLSAYPMKDALVVPGRSQE